MKNFTCDNCGQVNPYFEISKNYEGKVPKRWITIDINNFFNANDAFKDRKIITDSGEKHFCCNDCFINYFFIKKLAK